MLFEGSQHETINFWRKVNSFLTIEMLFVMSKNGLNELIIKMTKKVVFRARLAVKTVMIVVLLAAS